MKTKTLLSMVLGLASATSLMATTVDVYITGSTAFRANVFTACCRLYSGSTPAAIYFGTNSAAGGDANYTAKTASWCMTGTPITALTNIGTANTLVIHGLFNGSIQGLKGVVLDQKLQFATPNGNFVSNSITANTPVAGVPLYACNSFVSKTPTIGFSDSSGQACPYQASGNYAEEDVAVQPFVVCKSVGWGAAALAVSNINNVSWEQLEYGIPQGRIPLSAWTYKNSDTNNWIYLLQRTLDSGTRRCETAGNYYQYGDPVGIYIYDRTNNNWFVPTVTANASFGTSPDGVVGAAGLTNIVTGIPANLEWGYGYVGGGDIANSLNLTNGNGSLVPSTANQAIAYLSIGDAKSVGASNWAQVVSFNGVWPTAAGAGLHGYSGTNDYSPITSGYYPCWGKEVLVHWIDPTALANGNDQGITQTQLGNNTSPGSFLGVFNAQTGVTPGVTTTPLVGSVENEIELSKSGGATGIRLSDMANKRGSVGGIIAPF
jgi:hypothetical protein